MTNPRIKKGVGWILGIILIIVLFKVGDVSEFKKLREVNVTYIVPILFCTFAQTQLLACRWAIVLKAIHPFRDYPAGFFSRATFLGVSSGIFTSRALGITATRLFYLNKETLVPIEHGLFSVIFGRLLELLLAIILCLGALSFFAGGLSLQWSAIVLLLLLLAFIASPQIQMLPCPIKLVTMFYLGIMAIVSKLPFWSQGIRKRLIRPDTYYIDRKTVTLIAGYTAGRFILMVFRLYIIALAFQIEASFEMFLVAVPLAVLGLIINITPWGVGVADLNLFAIFSLFGMEPGDTTLFVVGRRVVDIISLLSLTVIIQLFFRIKTTAK